MTHNFPVYAEGLSVCSNGVTLVYREPWRGDQIRTRTFNWVNNDRHQRGIRHIEEDHHRTDAVWVKSLSTASKHGLGTSDTTITEDNTLAEQARLEVRSTSNSEPEALSQAALDRWELVQRQAHSEYMAALGRLRQQAAERNDSMQRVDPPPGFEHLGPRLKNDTALRPDCGMLDVFSKEAGAHTATISSKPSTKEIDVDTDGYAAAMRSLFGPFDLDKQHTQDSHNTT